MRVGCGCLLYILPVFPLLFLFILLASISTWVLDRDFYQEVLSEPEFLAEALDESVVNWSRAGLPADFGDVPPAALNAGMRALMTPEYLRSAATDTVDQVFDVLEGASNSVTFVFDLVPIKASLQGEGASAFASAYVGALPACNVGDESAADGLLPACRPAEVSQAALIDQVTEALPAAAERLPDDLTVNNEVIPPDIGGMRLQPGSLRTLFTTGLVILGIVVIILWLLDGFIGATDTRSRFLWLGLTLLIPAGLVLLAGLNLTSPTLETVIRDSINRAAGQNTQFMMSVVTTGFSVSEQVRAGFVIAGAVPTLAAVLLLMVGLTVRPTDKRRNDGRYVEVPRR